MGNPNVHDEEVQEEVRKDQDDLENEGVGADEVALARKVHGVGVGEGGPVGVALPEEARTSPGLPKRMDVPEESRPQVREVGRN
jgi:hypothetical protein